MRDRSRLSVILFLLLLASCAETAPAPQVPPALADVVAALRDGGHVIFLRHAATDTAIPAGGDDHRDECGRQRNLTDAGRADARAFGAALRALEVPITEVRASPFCRTEETARLAFGTVRTDERLLPTAAGDRAGAEELLVPPPRGNRVLVGHSSTMADLLDVHLEEGEAAVLEAGPDGRPRLVGRLSGAALGVTS